MSVLEIPEHAYHADMVDDERPTLSSSLINTLVTRSPAHARAAHPRLNPELTVQDKKEFDIGTAAHALLLEDDMSGVEILMFDDFRTKAAREARDLARAHGKVPLLEKDFQMVADMYAALRKQFRKYDPVPFTDGAPERTLVWEERGVLCRARVDWLRLDGNADDYKTAASADPAVWSRRMVDHGCHIQQAFYLRGIRAVFGDSGWFRFVVAEKEPPYAVTVFQVAPDLDSLAEKQIDWAIDTWARCLETGVWPAYTDRVAWVNAEPWHEMRWLDREARDEL